MAMKFGLQTRDDAELHMGWVFCQLGSLLGRKLKFCKNYAHVCCRGTTATS